MRVATLASEVRAAAGRCFRAKTTSAAVAASLAVGVGLSTVVFAASSWLVLRPVPGLMEADRIAIVQFGQQRASGALTVGRLSYSNRDKLDSEVASLETLAGYQQSEILLGGRGGAARIVPAEFVTHDYFPSLGVTPASGRFFTADEDRPQAPRLVSVMTERLAAEMFPERSAVGQVLPVNGLHTVVIGTVSDPFRGLDRFGINELWLPGATYYTLTHSELPAEGHGGFYEWFGRLKAGASFEEAQAELTVAARRLADGAPENQKFAEGVGPTVYPKAGLDPQLREVVPVMLLGVWLVVGLVLFVTCANVANLTLARTTERRHSWAVRRALGATTSRLVRMEAIESVLVALVGAVAAVVLAWYGTRLFAYAVIPFVPAGYREMGTVPVDWTVVLFGLGVSLTVALSCSAVSALVSTRSEPSGTLASGASIGGPERQRAWKAVCVAQVSCTVVLVVCGFLFVQTLSQLGRVDTGFEGVEGEESWVFFSTPERLGYDSGRAARYFDDLTRRLREIGGVDAVAVTTAVPFRGGGFRVGVYPAGFDADINDGRVLRAAVSPGFFRAVGVRVLAGRGFDVRAAVADAGRNEVILSEGLAARLFGGAEAIGRRVAFNWSARRGREYEVVGVVADARWESLSQPPSDMVYELADREAALDLTFVVITSSLAPETLRLAVERAAAGIDPNLPIAQAGLLGDGVRLELSVRRLVTRLLIGLAVMALLLSAAGLYGVMSRWVTGRIREFGIRAALGATPGSLAAMVLTQAAGVVGRGLIIGCALALLVGRVMAAYLYGVAGTEWMSYVATGAVVVLTAMAATSVPAARALRLDAATVLRQL